MWIEKEFAIMTRINEPLKTTCTSEPPIDSFKTLICSSVSCFFEVKYVDAIESTPLI